MPRRATDPDRYLKFGLALWQGRPSRFEAFHRHSEIELLLVEAGRLTYLFSRGRVELSAGTLAVFWGAMPHKLIDLAPRTYIHWLTVPLPWFLQWSLPRGFQDALLQGDVLQEPNPARHTHDLDLFRQWHTDVKEDVAEARAALLLEAEARLRRLALACQARRARSPRVFDAGGAADRVEQLAAFIAERYRQPLTVAEIAAAAGLNPEYATTLFRKTTGMTLIDYVTEHRLSHAQRLLTTTRRKVLDIALDAGFGSLSRFYEAFTKACGQTPRAFRSAAQHGAA